MKTLLLTLLLSSLTASADQAFDLLKASDEGRGSVQDGIQWKIKIQTTEDEESTSREFFVKAKDHDAYVEATAPARNKGEIYIFNDRNMWFFKPSLKKPVSISARQKLTGQAANGDIASTHYARDYTPTIEKTDTINGEKVHVLLLKAKSNNLTYDQIRYYISDKTHLAVKADFLNLQGQAFKIGVMEYKNTLKTKGRTIPFISQLLITDAKFSKNKSSINYESPKLESVSDSLFNVNNLSR